MVKTQPRKLSDFEPLTPAEKKVLDELDTGEMTVLGDGMVPPESAGGDRRLRARFLRWLVLGRERSEHRLHESGLQITGALIAGEGDDYRDHAVLDLVACKIDSDLLLMQCRFVAALDLRGAVVQEVVLDGSHLPELNADRLETRVTVSLRGAEVGEVHLLGARIGGDLSCNGATLRNADGVALDADRLETRGTVFLDGMESWGAVRLLGARIGGDLVCEGATLRNPGEKALVVDGARVDGALYLRTDEKERPARIEGTIDLASAVIGHINDDLSS